MHRIYISEQLGQGEVLVTGEAHHYVTRVVRLKAGDRLILFNDSGWEWVGKIVDIDRRRVKVEVEDKRFNPCEPSRSIWLFQGFPKGNKFFDIVRSATALGVNGIIPFIAERSVGGGTGKSKTWLERCERIASQASRQCGRVKTPAIRVPYPSLSQALDHVGSPSASIQGPCFWEEANESIDSFFESTKIQDQYDDSICVVIGPEGGLTQQEAQEAHRRGLRLCHLGSRVLRTELAPVVGLSILQFYFGELK